MNEHPSEGVIRFDLDHRESSLDETGWEMPFLRSLDGWRSILKRLGLIGQDPSRYHGYGFGNLSHRAGTAFVISGSQTGERRRLGRQGWSLVTSWDLESFRIRSAGPVAPSSESLTHALIYGTDPGARCVVHVHSPELWRAAGRLDLPQTSADVDYGSPQMVEGVRRLFGRGLSDIGVFSMAGHEDGIVAFGTDVDDACGRLLGYLAQAMAVPLV